MSTLSDIERLLIERACERLIYEFAEAVDQRNDAHLANLFSEDATYARPTDPNTVTAGRDNIVKAFMSRPGGRITRHQCSNVMITVESPTRARGVSRIVLVSGPSDSEPHPQFGHQADPRQLVGEFVDEFVKTAEGWRFASRRGRVTLHT